MRLLKTGEDNIDKLYWEIDKLPMIIYSDYDFHDESIRVRLPYSMDAKNMLLDNISIATNGSYLYFKSDLKKGQNIFWILHSSELKNNNILENTTNHTILSVEYGLPETLRGMSLSKLAKLDKFTYGQTKIQWAFPLKSDFHLYIEHENGAHVIEKGIDFPEIHKTLKKEFGGWILFDDGKQSRVKVKLVVG